jgi:hypothetical protein
MKICKQHWQDLRAAIAERGLDRFVSSNGEEAMRKVQLQLQPGESELAKFDPLLNANFAIWNNALSAGGPYMLASKPDGTSYCPLCEVESHTDIKAQEWITHAADEQLQAARNLGLLPPAHVK